MSSHDIRANRILLPDGRLAAGAIGIEGETIRGIDGAPGKGQHWDFSEFIVLPGIVDLHGDAFERQIMPRPGVRFDMALALLDTDRQVAANGMTTAFHAVTYSFEPGLRGRATMLAFLEALDAVRTRLGCDTRVHLRQEAYNLDAVDEICGWIEAGRIDLLAFNDHTPSMLAKLDKPRSLARHVDRTGLDLKEFAALLRSVQERADDVPGSTARLAAAARAMRIPLASHDDETPAMRDRFRALGCMISEFPLNEPTAVAALRQGDAVVLGAPNVVRGGSHNSGVDAATMIRRNLCDVLASDYYYPSLLQAPFRLVRDGIAPLGEAWSLVSANPAVAAGLNDRGAIAAGRRADLVIIDDALPDMPRVVATFAAGRPIFVDGSLARLAA